MQLQEIKIESQSNNTSRRLPRRNPATLEFFCSLIFVLGMFGSAFYIPAFVVVKPKVDKYNNFYDSRCSLINITTIPYNSQYDLIIFNFAINYNSQLFYTQVKKQCPKFETECREYRTDTFDCRFFQTSNTYSFETDRGGDPFLLFFGLLVAGTMFFLCIVGSCLSFVFEK